MVWILLRTLLAWWTARVIKKHLFKTDFSKLSATMLAIIWGIVWSIVAAFAFEYVYGAGTFNNKTLVPSIIFTAVAAYYALIKKDFTNTRDKND